MVPNMPVHMVILPMVVIMIVSKDAKIRNRYNQEPYLTQDSIGKVTNSQLYNTHENQEVSPFPAGNHKAQINRRAQRHNKHKREKNIKDPQKKYCLETVSKYCINLTLNSDVDQTHRYLVCMKDL